MIYLFAFLAVVFLVLSISPREKSIVSRLKKIMGEAKAIEHGRSFRERVISPIIHSIVNRAAKVAPRGHDEKIIAQLILANIDNNWSITEWQGLKYGIALGGGFIALIIAAIAPVSLILRLEIVILGFLFSYLAPSIWLKHKGKVRMTEITETLPDVLDLLTISVEAGLGFDTALMKVVEKGKGILVVEFLRVLHEIKMGKPRRDSLRDLAKRNPTDDVKTWVAALVQADQLGISMGGVMRNQSKEIRTRRRQRIEEKAQKAPVKVMLPLVFFIFPCVFIVVLGPAVIQIITMFK
ncbi:MAG: type II secretion system F family protein [Desulfosporosinus sp.]|nr:type II secretion system F family protein [Desulfosporosinus sp.]